MRLSSMVGIVIAVMGFLAASTAVALTAVVEVNEHPWYTTQKPTMFGGAELTRFYAPLPVFFEGWKSSPRVDIVDYEWDFGDGSPVFHGFNAAHVYENPGQYQAKLTVRDATGASDSKTIAIEALVRDGKTYYVDSELGNDANNGLSPGAGAWKTATYAFQGMAQSRYRRGDQILFKRGQTFDLVSGTNSPGHSMAKYGYKFSAYGTGPKPIIQHVGTSTGNVINQIGVGLAHLTIEDLEFRMTSAEGAIAGELYYVTQPATNILFLRVDIKDFGRGITISGGTQSSGVFVVGCTMTNSSITHLYTTGQRIAVLDSTLDLAGNHLCYFEYVDKGVISGNTFSRPPFGRHALRLCGLSETNPSNNVVITHNNIVGWIDPLSTGGAHNGGGKSYNWLLVHMAPNTNDLKWAEDVLFENNTITDGQCLLNIGSDERITVRNNVFKTQDTASVPRILIGSIHGYDHRPTKDIRIENNVIITTGTDATAPILRIGNYASTPYNGQAHHEGFSFANNTIRMANGNTPCLSLANKTPEYLQEVVTDNNLIYRDSDTNLISLSTGDNYNLSQWRLVSGHDMGTQVDTQMSSPVAGLVTAPPLTVTGPVSLSYEDAWDASGTGIKAARLWAQVGDGLWYDTGQSSTSVSGSLSFNGFTGPNSYRFALAVEDNTGKVSFSPSGAGQMAETSYVGPATISDTTPPVAGAASAPANLAGGPVSIGYSGASDAGGSGLREVNLWVRKGDGPWVSSGLHSPSAQGTFTYTGVAGNDTYYFAMRAVDNSGNSSALPSGNGDCATVYAVPLPSSSDELLAFKMDTAPATGAPDSSPLSTNGACAAPSAPALQADGRINGAYLFDGVDDSITINHVAQRVTGAFSVTAWIKAPPVFTYTSTTVSKKGTILGINTAAGDNLCAVYVGGNAASINNKICILDGGTNQFLAPTPMIVADDTWHFVAYTSDGTTGTVYVDGLKMSTHAVRYTFRATDQWAIGQEYDNAVKSDFYQGLLDELSIWNRVLTPEEVNLLFLAAPPVVAATDTTAPNVGTMSVPGAVSETALTVSYSGVTDTASGLKAVHLWAKKDAGAWTDTGLGQTQSSGSFDYVLAEGAGTYYFALVAEDNAGNTSAAVSGNGQANTVYDATAPTAATVTAPTYAKSGAIALTYTGGTDAGGSALKAVHLWVRKDAGAWADSGTAATAASGTFAYTPSTGDGRYYFATVTEDNAGNLSATPSGNGSANTAYDGSIPTVGTATSPDYSRTTPISITYSGVADTGGSGLKTVHLWARKDAGAWADTTLTNAAASGTFAYTAGAGKGTYYFAVQGEDNAGNLSPLPTGAGASTTVYDNIAPVTGTATPPAYANASPIVLPYSGAGDVDSGLVEVRLWAKKGTGAWTDTGLTSTAGSGNFSYAGSGAATYAFALQATDAAGNKTATPSGAGAGSTILDMTAPTVGTLTAPATATSAPISVSYTGAADTGGSGLKTVKLWVLKSGATVWQDTGLSATTASGAFSYNGFTGNGTYAFAVQSEDKAGNRSAAPSGQGQASTQYTVTFAPGTASAPAYTKTSPVTVSYTGAAPNASTITLWVKIGTTGSWTSTGLTASGSSGSFAYSGFQGDGRYAFATQGRLTTGETTAVPTGEGDATTIFDTTAPLGGKLTSPNYTRKVPFTVTYTGASDTGSGIKLVHLWVKEGYNGAWQDTGQTSAGAAGSFTYTNSQRNIFFFYLQAEDNAGNKSAAPTDGMVFKQ